MLARRRFEMSQRSKSGREYWRANVRLVLGLLAVWFAVSFGGGIFFADWLDGYRFFGFRLGFWISQQGAILIFIALIFVYVARMNALDREHGVHEEDEAR